MILVGAIGLGAVLALALGGRLERLLGLEIRDPWAVAAALAMQIVLFSRLGEAIPGGAARPLHLATYALLAFFIWRNRQIRPLLALGAGMMLNAIAIAANGGRMPLSRSAAEAAGIVPADHANVSLHAHRLWFLGDVFALPRRLPFTTVISPGDLVICFGVVALIVMVSFGDRGSAPLDLSRLRAPLRNMMYKRLLAARAVSFLGDWLTIAAVVGWIYRGTHSTAAVALVMLVRLAPPIVGGGVAAIVVDRLPRRGLLVGLELMRAVCVGGALAGVLFDSRAAVLAALAGSGALTALTNSASSALVPSLLPSGELAAGNALLALAKDVAMALGAAAAGAAVAHGGPAPALVADVATFLVAAFLLRGLAAMPRRPERGHALAGLRYLRRHRLVLLLVVAFGTATAATGIVNATLPSLLAHAGFAAGGYGYGMAALAAGAAIGEAIIGLTALAPTADRWIGIGLLWVAGLFGLLAIAHFGPTAILCLAVIGLVDGTTDVVYSTVLQRETDDEHLGAVFGASTSLMTTTMVIAFAVAPAIGAVLGPGGAVGLAAAVVATAGVVALVAVRRSPVRHGLVLGRV